MANLALVTSVIPESTGIPLSTTLTDVVRNTAGSHVVIKVESLIIANVDGVNDVDISVYMDTPTSTVPIAKTITVPSDSTLVVLTKDNPIYLNTDYGIKAEALTNGDATILITYETITTNYA